jgi:DnaJ like chaperone protein
VPYDVRMSVWKRIGDFLAGATPAAFSNVVESVRTVFEGDPATRRHVAFSIAVIALSAKMAKADGVVTQDEINAFHEIFDVPEHEAGHVAKIYDLAKGDVAGFVAYAQQVKSLFPGNPPVLEDVLDGLYHIAKADGLIHTKEQAFLDTIADVFGLEEELYERIKLRHMHPEEGDPYLLLEASSKWDNDTLKAHYRQLVKQNHPDRLIARGVPPEFVAIANGRLAAINQAWANIRRERGL